MPSEVPTTKASSYERVTIGKQSFRASILGETDLFLHVRKVDKYGDETEDRMVGDVCHVREHLIDKSVITRRTPLKMNLTYGELENA